MRKIMYILIYLLLMTARLWAATDSNTSEVLPSLDNNATNTAVLNDQLRQTDRRLLSLEGGININTQTTGILSVARGGTGTSTFNPFPSGGIIMWSGTIASIPSGWVICDGTNSTPDLRNRFIVGADADVSGVAKSTVTGSAAQSGNGQLPSTSLFIQWPTKSSNAGGASFSGTTSDPFGSLAFSTGIISTSIATVSFGTGSLNVATFYALAYIMKT